MTARRFSEAARDMQPIAAAVSRLMQAMIAAGPTPSEQKERIMIAREYGLITDAETTALIRAYGLRAA